MPKRATLTYTSEDAPAPQEAQLYVYYCRFSGRHVFTTNCDIAKQPRRRTDLSRIIDTEKFMVKEYTTDGGVKLIMRHDGKIERQYRQNMGKLAISYRSEPDGRYLYVLDGAITTYVRNELNAGERVPVPPCISRGLSGVTEIRMDLEDKSHRTGLIKVNADGVRVGVTHNCGHAVAHREVLEFMARILGTRLTQMQLQRGRRSRIKTLVVEALSPEQVYEKLQEHLFKMAQEAEQRGGRV